MPEGASGHLDSAAFMEALRSINPWLEEHALEIGKETGEAVVAVAKSLAPVATTDLQKDIKVQGVGHDKRGVYVDVGTVEPYALYQEFGTVHNPAHPFMRPAIAQITGQAISGKVALVGVKKQLASHGDRLKRFRPKK